MQNLIQKYKGYTCPDLKTRITNVDEKLFMI